MFRQLTDIQGLLCRQSGLAHPLRPQFHNACGRERLLSCGGVQPREDDARDSSAQLLVDNRPHQRLKARLAILDPVRSRAFDNLSEDLVFFEMLESSAHGW